MSVLPPYLSPAPTPGTTTSPADVAPPHAESSSSAQLRADQERLLLKLSQDLYEMEVCAGDVVAGQEDRVPAYLREIDRSLVQLSELAGRLEDTVPRQVVDLIDRHRNPHTYTRGTLSRATGENQYALGRVLGLEAFRKQLHDAVGQEFPEIPLPERRHDPALTSESAGEKQNGPDLTVKAETAEAAADLGRSQDPATTDPSMVNGGTPR